LSEGEKKEKEEVRKTGTGISRVRKTVKDFLLTIVLSVTLFTLGFRLFLFADGNKHHSP
jgi:hypothetical protein